MVLSKMKSSCISAISNFKKSIEDNKKPRLHTRLLKDIRRNAARRYELGYREGVYEMLVEGTAVRSFKTRSQAIEHIEYRRRCYMEEYIYMLKGKSIKLMKF